MLDSEARLPSNDATESATEAASARMHPHRGRIGLAKRLLPHTQDNERPVVFVRSRRIWKLCPRSTEVRLDVRGESFGWPGPRTPSRWTKRQEGRFVRVRREIF